MADEKAPETPEVLAARKLKYALDCATEGFAMQHIVMAGIARPTNAWRDRLLNSSIKFRRSWRKLKDLQPDLGGEGSDV